RLDSLPGRPRVSAGSADHRHHGEPPPRWFCRRPDVLLPAPAALTESSKDSKPQDSRAVPPLQLPFEPPRIVWEEPFVVMAQTISNPKCTPGSDPDCNP